MRRTFGVVEKEFPDDGSVVVRTGSGEYVTLQRSQISAGLAGESAVGSSVEFDLQAVTPPDEPDDDDTAYRKGILRGWVPSPAEIRATAAEIRAEWSPAERLRRAGFESGTIPPWLPPGVLRTAMAATSDRNERES